MYKYPSITEILSKTKPFSEIEAIEKWKNKIGHENANKIYNDSIKRGKRYDKYIEGIKNGIESPIIELNNFFKEYNLIEYEKIVNNDNYCYSGRFDAILKYHNNIIITDFKGSSKYKNKKWINGYSMQLSAYSKCVKCDYGLILVIIEDKLQKIFYTKNELNYYFDMFLERLKDYNNKF